MEHEFENVARGSDVNDLNEATSQFVKLRVKSNTSKSSNIIISGKYGAKNYKSDTNTSNQISKIKHKDKLPVKTKLMRFNINNIKACKESSHFKYLVYVFSAVPHFDRRTFIRNT